MISQTQQKTVSIAVRGARNNNYTLYQRSKELVKFLNQSREPINARIVWGACYYKDLDDVLHFMKCEILGFGGSKIEKYFDYFKHGGAEIFGAKLVDAYKYSLHDFEHYKRVIAERKKYKCPF